MERLLRGSCSSRVDDSPALKGGEAPTVPRRIFIPASESQSNNHHQVIQSDRQLLSQWREMIIRISC